MPKTLTASPATYFGIGGLACSEALVCDEQLLLGADVVASYALTLVDGFFPGTFPGATSYPGRGNTLGARAIVSKTLTGSPV